MWHPHVPGGARPCALQEAAGRGVDLQALTADGEVALRELARVGPAGMRSAERQAVTTPCATATACLPLCCCSCVARAGSPAGCSQDVAGLLLLRHGDGLWPLALHGGGGTPQVWSPPPSSACHRARPGATAVEAFAAAGPASDVLPVGVVGTGCAWCEVGTQVRVGGDEGAAGGHKGRGAKRHSLSGGELLLTRGDGIRHAWATQGRDDCDDADRRRNRRHPRPSRVRSSQHPSSSRRTSMCMGTCPSCWAAHRGAASQARPSSWHNKHLRAELREARVWGRRHGKPVPHTGGLHAEPTACGPSAWHARVCHARGAPGRCAHRLVGQHRRQLAGAPAAATGLPFKAWISSSGCVVGGWPDARRVRGISTPASLASTSTTAPKDHRKGVGGGAASATWRTWAPSGRESPQLQCRMPAWPTSEQL